MKKFVLKLELADASEKRRVLKTVASLSGIDEIAVDFKGKKLIVIGTVDPVIVASKLRKRNWLTDIISVGPAKEPEKPGAKKEEAKKEEPKGGDKKDGSQKEKEKEGENKEGDKKKGKPEQVVAMLPQMPPYLQYHPQPNYGYSYYRQYPPLPSNGYPYWNHNNHSMEENPDSCSIC